MHWNTVHKKILKYSKYLAISWTDIYIGSMSPFIRNYSGFSIVTFTIFSLYTLHFAFMTREAPNFRVRQHMYDYSTVSLNKGRRKIKQQCAEVYPVIH